MVFMIEKGKKGREMLVMVRSKERKQRKGGREEKKKSRFETTNMGIKPVTTVFRHLENSSGKRE